MLDKLIYRTLDMVVVLVLILLNIGYVSSAENCAGFTKKPGPKWRVLVPNPLNLSWGHEFDNFTIWDCEFTYYEPADNIFLTYSYVNDPGRKNNSLRGTLFSFINPQSPCLDGIRKQVPSSKNDSGPYEMTVHAGTNKATYSCQVHVDVFEESDINFRVTLGSHSTLFSLKEIIETHNYSGTLPPFPGNISNSVSFSCNLSVTAPTSDLAIKVTNGGVKKTIPCVQTKYCEIKDILSAKGEDVHLEVIVDLGIQNIPTFTIAWTIEHENMNKPGDTVHSGWKAAVGVLICILLLVLAALAFCKRVWIRTKNRPNTGDPTEQPMMNDDLHQNIPVANVPVEAPPILAGAGEAQNIPAANGPVEAPPTIAGTGEPQDGTSDVNHDVVDSSKASPLGAYHEDMQQTRKDINIIKKAVENLPDRVAENFKTALQSVKLQDDVEEPSVSTAEHRIWKRLPSSSGSLDGKLALSVQENDELKKDGAKMNIDGRILFLQLGPFESTHQYLSDIVECIKTKTKRGSLCIKCQNGDETLILAYTFSHEKENEDSSINLIYTLDVTPMVPVAMSQQSPSIEGAVADSDSSSAATDQEVHVVIEEEDEAEDPKTPRSTMIAPTGHQ